VIVVLLILVELFTITLFIIYIIKQLLTGACIFIFVWFYIVLHFQNVGFYLKVKERHHAWKLPSGQ